MSEGLKINSGTLTGTLFFNFAYIPSKFANLA